MRWPLALLCWLFLTGLSPAAEFKVQLFLSWNLRPYWDFAEGFKKNHHFQAKISLLEEGDIWETARVLVPVGHRALSFLEDQSQKPLWAALILHPSLIPKRKRLLGGLYLRLPPEVVLPLIRARLAPLFGERTLVLGIPYSTEANLSFLKEVQKISLLWGLKVVPLPLAQGLSTYEEALKPVDVIYFLPDPFLESEEVISRLIKMAVMAGKVVVGYNRFFLEKGGLLAFVIDYYRAGIKASRLLYRCLNQGDCGWHYAPFKLLWNEKALRYYQVKEKERPAKKPSSSSPIRGRK